MEDPGSLPLLEASVRGTRVADSSQVECVPLHTGAQHQQDRVHHLALWQALAVCFKRVLGRGRQKRLDSLPQPVRHSPAIVAVDQAHVQPSYVRSTDRLRDSLKEMGVLLQG